MSARCFADVANIALCLRLSTTAVNVSSSKTKSDLPILARLGRKFKGKHVNNCSKLRLPPVAQLLSAQLHIFVRLSEYDDPIAGWKLATQFNPAGYIAQIEAFLEASPATLDTGFFLPYSSRSPSARIPRRLLCLHDLGPNPSSFIRLLHGVPWHIA